MSKEKISGIYCIENLENHKKYIGLSKNIKKRWNDHKYRLNKNDHENNHLQRSWNKYGKNKFTFYILETCSEDELSEKEKFYINKFNTSNYKFGFNGTLGGEVGFTFTEESMLKRRESQYTRPVIQFDLDGNEIKRYKGCEDIHTLLGFSKGTICGCCNNRIGRKTYKNFIWVYEDDYNNFGINLEDYVRGTVAKPVKQYDINGKYITTYKSAREAESATGASYKHISSVCNGKRNTCGGYIWKFA